MRHGASADSKAVAPRTPRPGAPTTVGRSRFLAEAETLGIESGRAGALYSRLFEPPPPTDVSLLSPRTGRLEDASALSRMVEVAIGLGVTLLIGAHAWWTTGGYEELGFGLVLSLTLVWMAAFSAAAEIAHRRGYRALTGGFAAVVAFYAPLAVYSLERLLGVEFQREYRDFYPWISEGWVVMELTAIAIAALLLVRYRRPFQTLPVCLFVGFLSMDLGARLVGIEHYGDALESLVLAVGGALAIAGLVLDHRGWRRFAFWPHIVSFWLVAWGVTGLIEHASVGLFLLAGWGIAAGVWLARRSYLAAGGVAGWGALTAQASGPLFPFLLLTGGILFISAAVWLARGDGVPQRWLGQRGLPAPQRDLGF